MNDKFPYTHGLAIESSCTLNKETIEISNLPQFLHHKYIHASDPPSIHSWPDTNHRSRTHLLWPLPLSLFHPTVDHVHRLHVWAIQQFTQCWVAAWKIPKCVTYYMLRRTEISSSIKEQLFMDSGNAIDLQSFGPEVFMARSVSM